MESMYNDSILSYQTNLENKMKPAQYAMTLYLEVNGDITEFFKLMQQRGKSFAVTERQFYACRKNTYNRYA